jgi:acetyl esterase
MEPLAPGMRRTGKVMRRMPGASIARATDAEIERNSGATAPEFFASILQGTKPRGVTAEDVVAGDVPVRVYRRSAGSATGTSSGTARKPLIVYFHGGGFVYGDLRGGDWLCGTVAKELDAVVVSVQYRLAPKHPFPAGPDDCYAALVWVAQNAADLGADASRLGVMGESAGGNLAAVVTLQARDAALSKNAALSNNAEAPVIRHQALLYPATGAGDTESRRANADAFILTAADMQKFGELYGGDVSDWRVSPIKAKSLAGLPPALIIVGGHDPLHDDGTLYADALRKAGDEVQLIEYPSMPHGFMNFPRYARDAKPAIAAVIASQRAALA